MLGLIGRKKVDAGEAKYTAELKLESVRGRDRPGAIAFDEGPAPDGESRGAARRDPCPEESRRDESERAQHRPRRVIEPDRPHHRLDGESAHEPDCREGNAGGRCESQSSPARAAQREPCDEGAGRDEVVRDENRPSQTVTLGPQGRYRLSAHAPPSPQTARTGLGRAVGRETRSLLASGICSPRPIRSSVMPGLPAVAASNIGCVRIIIRRSFTPDPERTGRRSPGSDHI